MPGEFRSELDALSPKDICTQARILRLLSGKAPRDLGMNRVRRDLDPGFVPLSELHTVCT
jgi:hypothetical protein